MKNGPVLVIVQDGPTQFDAPLYARMRREAELDLHVYYTAAEHPVRRPVDAEIGRAPHWDHLQEEPDAPAWQHCVAGRGAGVLAREIAQLEPALVILSGYAPLLHARLAVLLRLRGIRIGLRSDNTLRHSQFRGLRGLLKRAFLPALLRFYHSWHPVGTLARAYLERVGQATRPTFLFPYNVDNAWFAEHADRWKAEHAAVRAGMGLASGDFAVLGVMKWHPREDPLTLVEAFSRVADTCPEARLVLVGDGPLRDAVRARLEPLAERVHVPGYVSYSELPRFYSAADVFVHPAVGEPWGVSVNEAMACGLPVVAAEGVGAGADLIVDGETGFTFPDGDVEALVAVLGRLAADREGIKRLGCNARERVGDWDYGQSIGQMQSAVAAVGRTGAA